MSNAISPSDFSAADSPSTRKRIAMRGLEPPHHRRGRAEDAGGVAGRQFVCIGWVGKDAAQASGAAGPDCPDPAFGADASAVNPGEAIANAKVVEEITRRDVVGAVENEIDIGERFDVGGVGIGDDRRRLQPRC